jgi:hypothetical protein
MQRKTVVTYEVRILSVQLGVAILMFMQLPEPPAVEMAFFVPQIRAEPKVLQPETLIRTQ